MGIKDYSTTPANNDTAGSVNFAEGQNPSTVNDSARQVLADIREWYEDAEWRDLGDTPTYVSATSFTVVGDLTATYETDRYLKFTDATTLYGYITSSSYSSPNTTVNVTLDTGSLSGSLTAVFVGMSASNNGFPKAIDHAMEFKGGITGSNSQRATKVVMLDAPETITTTPTTDAWTTVNNTTLNTATAVAAVLRLSTNAVSGSAATTDSADASVAVRKTGSGTAFNAAATSIRSQAHCSVTGQTTYDYAISEITVGLDGSYDFDYYYTETLSGGGSSSAAIYLVGYHVEI